MSLHLGRFLGPVPRYIKRARAVVEIISRNPRDGWRLLLASRLEPRYQTQPDVYPFAAYLAERFDCRHAVVIGKPSATELLNLYPRCRIIGIVPSAYRALYRAKYAFAKWLTEDSLSAIPIPEDVLKRSVIVCKGVEEFADPGALRKHLKAWLNHAPVCLLANGKTRQADGGDVSPTHEDFEQTLRDEGFKVEFVGLTASNNVKFEKKTTLAVITQDAPKAAFAPASFRVVAFMAAYNEADIIVQSIKKWTDQGVRVHVLENWSTDATYELAKELEGRLPVTVERFPKDGPSQYFDWGAMLGRMEELAGEIEADWFVRRGADEVLSSPWPGVSYRDALYVVDQAGFNCVDHTIVEFHPVDDSFAAGMDHEAYFRHFDLKHLSHPRQRKAWKNCGLPISTIPSAGHDVVFAGRRIYPFKFLLKHYSFRSQKQAERKVFRERKARWNPKERARGWHIHYDAMKEGHRFVKLTSEKEVFDEVDFNKTYLVERLSGIGTYRYDK
jgi:hypothetical protein